MINSKGFPVSVIKLNWSYGQKKILNDICFNAEKGKFYSIIGPNGSGKTTFIRNLSKSLDPGSRVVYIDGVDIMRIKSRDVAKKISYVPQNTNISFDFTVMDIVLMGRTPYFRRFQVESDYDLELAKNAMLCTNTWHLRDKNINEISGGERQRVIIARALTQQTNIILMDEPVSQLDIHHQLELMETVKSLIDMKGITVIMVLHDLNLAAQYSDFIVLLNEGTVVSQGLPEDVLTKENIESVYKVKVHIMSHPVSGRPYIIPIGEKEAGGTSV